MKKVMIDGVETEVEDNYQEPLPDSQQNQSATTPQLQQQVDPSILNAYSAQLLEQARENRRLREQLEAQRVTPPAPPTADEERAFFDKPRAATEEIVRRELQTQVAPINAFVQNMQRGQLIAQLKQQMRQLPQQFPYVAQVEQLLDQLLANSPTIDPNVVAAAYNQAVGYYVSQGGTLTRENPAPVNNQPNNQVPSAPLPAHVRSSPPAPPRVNETGKKQLRQLNENEKKIARSRKMTDAEYLFWTEEVSGAEVAHITDEQIKERLK